MESLREKLIAAAALPDEQPRRQAGLLAAEAHGHVDELLPLLREADPRLRAATCNLLEAMGPSAALALPEVRHALTDAVPRVRAAAAGALGAIESEPAAVVDSLLPLLRDKEWPVQAEASRAIGRFGAAGLAMVTRRSLQGSVPASAIATIASWAMSRMRRAVLHQVSAALCHPALNIRQGALESLRNSAMAAEPVVPALLVAAQAPSACREVFEILGAHAPGRPEVVESLVQILRIGDQRAAAAAGALWDVGPQHPECVPVLVAATRHRDEHVRRAALRSLRGWSAAMTEFVTEIVLSLDDPSVEVRRLAARLLGAIGDCAVAAVPALLDLLQHPDPELRRRTADALSRIGAPAESIAAALTAALRSAGWGERAAFVVPLSRLGAAAVPLVVPLLAERDVDLRVRACAALGVMGSSAADALPELIRAASDPDARVRLFALMAIRRVDRSGLGRRQDLPWLGDEDPLVRAKAIEAIQVEGPWLVEPLATALSDPDARVRAAAATAIERAGPSARAAAGALERACGDESSYVRGRAVRALAAVDPDHPALIAHAVGLLGTPMDSEDVAAAFERLGARAVCAIPSLVKALSEPLARALVSIPGGIEAAIEVVRQALLVEGHASWEAARSAIWLQRVSPQARTIAIEALRSPRPSTRTGALGVVSASDGALLEEVVRALADSEVGVRSAAATALESMGPGAAPYLPLLRAAYVAEDDSNTANHMGWTIRNIQRGVRPWEP